MLKKKSSTSQSAVSPVMQTLTTYITTALKKPLPPEVLEKTKHHVLDTLAAMISGSKLLPGVTALAYVKTLGGTREATVAGSRFVTNVVNAAFANAMTAHSDETDDSHARSITHPGCSAVSAALAMAEREQSSGMTLLRAVALGYDITGRMGICLGGDEFSKTGHLTHCFAPSFGVAAAGAALARLDARQVRHVLSYTAQQAGGLSCYARDVDHIEKSWDFGAMAARNGLSAVTMVASGCSGVDDVFSGERNFFFAFDKTKQMGRPPQQEALVHELGKTYEIMHTNIKRWTVGSPIQAPLDALYELIRNNTFTVDDIEKVTVRVYAYGARITDNRDMADICLQHMCAVMLTDKFVTFEAAHDHKRMRDRQILALRAKITLISDDELQKLFPDRHGIVDIELKDGRKLHHHTHAVRGSAHNPMTRVEVDEKCHSLMASVIGSKRARTLCDAIWKLDRVKDVRELRPLLQA